ncbi:hypothetical protein ACJIZ3_024220 [Penstemon smallii]|uniref:Uncharacterized protein n=1 Tax=Penstemon smallii TaxID=265156 RepID=A0ABD3TR73_9LAMI
MNLLARTKPSAHLIFPSPSPLKRPFSLHLLTTAALQQCNFYSTKTTHNNQQSQQLTKPKTKRSSEPSLTFSQRVKKQTDSLTTTVWPKPREIPYQEKVANYVNLIGFVKNPVQFEAASDGTHMAATVISQENGGGRNSLMIPVVFEGNLAHVVACHVKENDCVFVSGQLSVDPLRLALSESLGKFHIVAENLNFVEGFKRKIPNMKKEDLVHNVLEIRNPDKIRGTKIEEVIESVNDDEEFNKKWKESLEHAKEKKAPIVSDKDSFELNANIEVAMPEPSLERANNEFKQVKGYEKSGENANKKKDANVILDLWRDLVKNPLQWWDYRGHKSNGLVKERFPDFKQKGTGESLWLSTAPAWVLPGLGKLEFDVKVLGGTRVQESEGTGERKSDATGEDPWKSLVENPNKWWDNRVGKRNPKAPDFKHRETGVGLWVSDTPKWALSKLPPMK